MVADKLNKKLLSLHQKLFVILEARYGNELLIILSIRSVIQDKLQINKKYFKVTFIFNSLFN